MFGSAILDTVIGLIFVYLLLSIITSTVKEIIEAFLQKRSKDLWQGVELLLEDPKGIALAKNLYEHPLIQSLHKPVAGSIWPKWLINSRPSYIPAQSFALALMDLLKPAQSGQTSGAKGALATTAVSQDGSPASPVKEFREAVVNNEGDILPQSVQESLLALVDASGDDIKTVRQNIEAWFDATMERVSGWYKRWSQVVLGILGLVITIGLNVDTFALCEHLSQNKEAREKLVAEAAKATPPEGKQDIEKLKKDLEKLNELGLPIGWGHVEGKEWVWVKRVSGWLLTAIAILMGSQFWFDVLSRFINLRSSMKPPEQGEPQKPKPG